MMQLLRRSIRKLWPAPFKPTWDGIYPHLRDVPADGTTYDDERRIAEMVEFAQGALAKQRSGQDPALWHETLAVFAGTVAAQGGVEVLDFGGAMGTAYIHLLATLPRQAQLRYRVVEQEKMCAAGRRLFDGDARISFDSSLDAVKGAPDVVYANSVLPYIEDYAGLLRRLAGLGARHFLIARLAGGSYPTYATRQLNLKGQVLGYWFHNTDEIKGILQSSGYALAYEGLTGPEYDQRNFPATHRVGRMRNLLFRRQDA
jgi:putative methyltransferase (TIGR04325 family)